MRFVLAYEGLLNLGSLNLERAAELRKMPVIYLTKDNYLKFEREAPAISGRMLKYWHFRNLVKLSRESNDNICFFCNRLEAIRIPDDSVQRYYNISYMLDEIALIEKCVAEDVHGFLATIRGSSLRRESCVKFSWAIAVGGRDADIHEKIIIVQHTRNVREIPSEEEISKRAEEVKGLNVDDLKKSLRQLQMPYPRPYTSEIFGFISVADLSDIGISFTDNMRSIDGETRRKRQKNTILAYAKMLLGEIGASISGSLPASGKFRLLLAASKRGHIPPPVHPIYPGYLEDSVKLIKGSAELFNDEAVIRIYSHDKVEFLENLENENSDKVDVKVIENPFEGFQDIIKFLGL